MAAVCLSFFTEVGPFPGILCHIVIKTKRLDCKFGSFVRVFVYKLQPGKYSREEFLNAREENTYTANRVFSFEKNCWNTISMNYYKNYLGRVECRPRPSGPRLFVGKDYDISDITMVNV